MSKLSETLESIRMATGKGMPIAGLNSLMLTDIAESLAMIADHVTERSATRAEDKEPAVPVSWIEAEITRLDSMDQEQACVEAGSIRAMLERWRRQEGLKDGSV